MRLCGHAGGLNARGEPCGNRALLADKLCVAHSRYAKANMKQRGQAGGRTRSRQIRVVSPDEMPAPPTTQEECEDMLRWVMVAVATGKLDPTTARETTNAAKALHGALTDRHNQADRIRKLEQLAKQRMKKGPLWDS